MLTVGWPVDPDGLVHDSRHSSECLGPIIPASGQCSVVNGQWSVLSAHCPVPSAQFPVLSAQY